ncbi:MAG TPA: alpha/beta hydrolase [Caulobacteraceae bacterium]|nr:alpha/beta hydrolase [Caulobacteraceae bacterium]
MRALRRATPLLLALLVPAALAACASSRQAEGPELARAAGWHWRIMPAGAFDLAVASSRRGGGDTLTVYLEGDGLAYVWRGQPALDPTPTDPVALRLALADPGKTPVAWIGRPCQYTLPDHGRHCQSAEWTGRRYAPEILDSIGAALDALKRRSGARRLVLVGYSGGGAVAVLLAGRRSDVARIITVAADLDLAYWTRREGLSPLTGSLDPADIAGEVKEIPQFHFTGADDEVVGTDVARAYFTHLPRDAPARLVEVPGFTHTCCWTRDWPSLFSAVNAAGSP